MYKPAIFFPALLMLLCFAACVRTPLHDGSPLNCVISLDGEEKDSRLLCGYNYDLINQFAAAEGRYAGIRLSSKGESILDSLRNGSLDMVVFPYYDSLATDSLLLWHRADSCGIWVFPAAKEAESEFAGTWLHQLHIQEDYARFRQPYLDIYNPLTRVSADFISPYDSLIRVYADTLGWDWKLLAALIYQESRFHIEARSSRGASGLMQLVPNTARNFGCEDWLDPEQNLKAGVALLMTLEKQFKGIAANRKELANYCLAAYNAGAARIRDCINYARHQGSDVSVWKNVAALIPDMKHDSIAALDTIKLGTFYGGETVGFVKSVTTFHERYRHICP